MRPMACVASCMPPFARGIYRELQGARLTKTTAVVWDIRISTTPRSLPHHSDSFQLVGSLSGSSEVQGSHSNVLGCLNGVPVPGEVSNMISLVQGNYAIWIF